MIACRELYVQSVLSTPILFAPGISIVKLDIDHDNKPDWPDDLDDFGLNFDFETAPGTNFEIDGVSALTGLSFSDLIPGTYSVVSDSAGVGLGTLIINEFVINPGLNDAWYYPETDGQGFFITVFPDLETVSLAWFTYDTELPPIDAISNLGDPGHRWLTAVGPIDGNQVLMNIELTSGGLFDTSTEIIRTDPPGSDGTILLTFDSCSTGTIEYNIPSINRQGIVPIERVVDDNIALCEVLSTQ